MLDKISWTDWAKSEVTLHSVEEGKDILHTTRRRKTTGIGRILRRNYILTHVIEGQVKGAKDEEKTQAATG